MFDNDFAALLPPKNVDTETNKEFQSGKKGLFVSQQVFGECKVVCFSPRHDLTLPLMSEPDIVKVVHTWRSQYDELCKKKHINYVQVFENKGAMMGCSNPHPHSQIWSSSFVPREPSKEIERFKEYHEHNESCLMCDYVQEECVKKERIIFENTHFLAVVPYWALYPYEVLLSPKRHVEDIRSLSEEEMAHFAQILKVVTIKYDNLFKTSFPYSMGFHMSPTDGEDYSYYHMHLHFYPPLLRSATIKKHLVGFELLSEPQRDLTPEQAAQVLNKSSGTEHYKNQK